MDVSAASAVDQILERLVFDVAAAGSPTDQWDGVDLRSEVASAGCEHHSACADDVEARCPQDVSSVDSALLHDGQAVCQQDADSSAVRQVPKARPLRPGGYAVLHLQKPTGHMTVSNPECVQELSQHAPQASAACSGQHSQTWSPQSASPRSISPWPQGPMLTREERIARELGRLKHVRSLPWDASSCQRVAGALQGHCTQCRCTWQLASLWLLRDCTMCADQTCGHYCGLCKQGLPHAGVSKGAGAFR